MSDFIFSNNKVDLLDGEAFRINANGRILIERNNFMQMSHSALSGILQNDYTWTAYVIN